LAVNMQTNYVRYDDGEFPFYKLSNYQLVRCTNVAVIYDKLAANYVTRLKFCADNRDSDA